MPDNTITLVGSLGHDVSLKFLDNGKAVGNVSLAVSKRWRNRQTNEWEEETSWFDVVVYGKLAQNAQASCVKGTRVIVTGVLKKRSWETQDGDKRSVIEVIADEFGPALSFATASVTRNPREDNGQQSRGGRASVLHEPPAEQPW